MSAIEFSGALRLPRRYGVELLKAVGAEVREDRLIYGAVIAYAAAVALFAAILGTTDKLHYFAYALIWIKGILVVASAWVILLELPRSIRANPASPLTALRLRLPAMVTPRAVAALGLVGAVILLKGSYTSVKTMLPDLTSFRWDLAFAETDRWLHGRDPWRILQPALGHHVVTRALQLSYVVGWLVAVCAIPAMVAASRRMGRLRSRFFFTYLFCWIVIGNLMAALFMSAGPAFFARVGQDPQRYAALFDYLSFSAGKLHSSFDLQNSLWRLHEAGEAGLGSGISAFPSMHVAMATLFCLLGWSVNRWTALAGTVFLLLIEASSVALGWHYAVDGYVSFLLTSAAWFGFGALERRRRKAQ